MQTIRKFNLLFAATTITCFAFTPLSLQAKARDRAHAKKIPMAAAAATAKLTPSPSASAEPIMRMPLVLPLFVQNQEFTSALMIVNGAAESTYADVVVTGLDGKDINHRRVDFAPHSQRRVEVLDLLQEVASPAEIGRITIMQSPDLEGMAVAAQLSISHQGSTQSSYIDEETAMPSAEGSQVLRAVADRTAGAPVVAVTSLSGTTQRVTMECLSEAGSNSSTGIELGAQRTVVVLACQPATAQGFDFTSIGNKDKGAPDRAVGIALSSDGAPGSFAAFALAPHKKGQDRYFSAVNFSDPKMTGSNIIFAGVPVGSSLLLPAGKYVPQAALANFSARAVRVQIQYAQTIGDVPNVQSVRDLTLPAQGTKQLVLDNLHGGPSTQNSFVITSDGAPGDLMAKLVSTSESALHEVEILAKDERSGNGGGHPWSLEQGNEATLLLFNPSPKPQAFTVLISGGNVFWEKVYQLASMQTQEISIRDLIVEKVADDKGKTLPQGSQSGLVQWYSDLDGKGRLLVSNKELAMARNFSCTGYYCLCRPSFNGVTTTFGVTSTVDFGGIQGDICQSPVPGPCCNQGTAVQFNVTSYPFSWSSGNASVAQISGSSTSQYVNLFGAGTGSATETGEICNTSTGCCIQQQPPATVKEYAQISSTTLTPTSTINLHASPTCTNVSVQVYHSDLTSVGAQTATLTVATYNTNPATGLSVAYNPQTQSIPLSGGPGSQPFSSQVCSSAGSGTVVIQATLSNPSTNLTITAPNPVSSAQTTLTITSN